MKVFINMLGVYPIGSLLMLDSGEMGLVSSASSDRPKVLLMTPDDNGGYLSEKEVDLSERDPVKGDFLRHVVTSISPIEKGIQPVQYLF